MILTTAMFPDVDAAIRARKALIDRGIGKDQISFLVSQAIHGKDLRVIEETMAPEGAAVGAVLGSAAGVVAATAAGLATIVLPGIGVLVLGPIVAAIASAGAGGITGGLIGAFAGSGITEKEAVVMQDAVTQGQIVMTVQTSEELRGVVREALAAMTPSVVQTAA